MLGNTKLFIALLVGLLLANLPYNATEDSVNIAIDCFIIGVCLSTLVTPITLYKNNKQLYRRTTTICSLIISLALQALVRLLQRLL